MKLSSIAKLGSALLLLKSKRNFRNFINLAVETRGFNSSFKISYSQGCEDLSIKSIISSGERGTYIDIGAHDPSRFSNTRLLYELGWRGINIDADEELLPRFLTERPDDVNICAAVGSEKEYLLNVFDEKLVSTVDSKKVEFEVSIGRRKVSERTVKGITLRSVLDKYYPQDRVSILLIDIEGSDFDALNSIDFNTLENWRFPKYLVLEAFPPVSEALSAPAVKLALSKGYKPLLVLPFSAILAAPDVD